jgi:UDP-2,3-diacylglucosamine pyrophosphatase LpxH
MRRCKLVVSDFHLGTGQLLETGEVNPFEDFIFDSRFVSFLDYYRSDEFEAAEVELILDGDFLNTLRVYMGEESSAEMTERGSVDKVKKIFAGHPELFDALARFAAAPNHRVTYITGNHDPALHWRAVREEWNRRLAAETHFPGFLYNFDGVWVEHGHQYTAANRYDPGKLFVKNARGEDILNLPWGCVWAIDYLDVIKKERVYIDRVQPFGRYLFLALFFDPVFAFRALGRLLWFFVAQRRRAGMWKNWGEFRRTLEIIRQTSILPRLDPAARKILARPAFHTVIFGHNHQAAYRRWGRDKLYVNVGTWNDIIHLDIQNLGRQRRMTYAFLDYGDGHGHRPVTRLKIWKGTRLTEEDVVF